MSKGASIGNGPEANGNSYACGPVNNSGPSEPVRHGWFCACAWCLV